MIELISNAASTLKTLPVQMPHANLPPRRKPGARQIQITGS
jgi:hypothetical protein